MSKEHKKTPAPEGQPVQPEQESAAPAEAADPAAAPLLRQTDLLIDGEYIRELDDGKGLRGSSNQRAIPLNARGEALLALWARQARRREVFRHGAEVHEVGLPGDAHSQTES